MKIAIIGGGAAGYFAAIKTAEQGAETWIFEKGNKTLSKVRISGGGRCNVTNVITEPSLLIQNYPRGSKELLGPFTRFNSLDTVNWFLKRGVELKSEPDGRMFPITDSSQTIIDCLTGEVAKFGVHIKLHSQVNKIIKQHSGFELTFENGDAKNFDAVIIASGGSPSLKSYEWLQQMGHTIVPPVPSLFTFNIPHNPFIEIMGVSVQEARVKIQGSKFEQNGPVLFTHWGLSGPAVLKLSAFAARWLHENNYNCKINISFVIGKNEEVISAEVQKFSVENKLKKIVNTAFNKLPNRLWLILCQLSDIDENLKWADISKQKFRKLIQNLSACELQVSGKTTFKEEFVTAGGVSLKEINMQTMESKIVKGLFFAGEILDIDGVTGGFNFQAAWTTGFLAGQAAVIK